MVSGAGKPRRWPWILGFVLAFGFGIAVGAADDVTTTSTNAEPAPTVTVTVSMTPTRSPTRTPTQSPTHSPTHSPTPITPDQTTPASGDGTALHALGKLTVKGRAPKTGYDRDAFGQAWADTNRNGCDTRNDILRRDLVQLEIRAGTNGCVVLSGLLERASYTSLPISFERGGASEIDIDHVVALSDAWQKARNSGRRRSGWRSRTTG